MMKNLYIVSGCNGAGKTTASYTVLPEILECREFVNADEIARGLSPFNAEGVAIEAGRLSSPELAMRRVAERVSKGGHDIPEEIIRRRYTAGINNLFKLFMPVVDYWAIFDNSATPRRIVATGGRKSETATMEEELLRTIRAYVK